MTAHHRTILLWLAAATVAGCAAGPEPEPGASQRRSSKLDGVAFTLRERAHDGTFVVTPASATPTEVDANARLVVSFQVEPQAELAAAGTEWQAFEAGLSTVQQLLGEGRALDTLEVDENDAAAVAQLQERLRQHYRRLGQFGREFQKAITLHRQDLDVDSILGGPAGNREPPLVNAARWLADELGRLRRAAGARVTNRERIRVLVQAYHEPLDGERQLLHVANYDKLPVGDLRPIDRYGLKLTPQERARLDAEIAASKRAAAAIRELQAGAKDFLSKVEQDVAKLRLAVGTLANTVRSAPDWRQRLTVSLEALTQLANSSADAEVKRAAGELANAFPKLLGSLESIGAQGNTAQLLDSIAARLRDGQPQAVLESVGDLRAVVESDLAALVEELQPHVATIGKAVVTLTERLGAAELQTLLPVPVREVLASLPSELPAARNS